MTSEEVQSQDTAQVERRLVTPTKEENDDNDDDFHDCLQFLNDDDDDVLSNTSAMRTTDQRAAACRNNRFMTITQAIPDEMDTTSSLHHHHHHHHHQTTNTCNKIRPGDRTQQQPIPPNTAPPRPTRSVSLALIGPAHSGKTALLQNFVYRQYVDTNNSVQTDKEVRSRPTSYFEKCLCLEETSSIRVQCYDITTNGPHCSYYSKKQRKEWRDLMSQMQEVLLVISLRGDFDDNTKATIIREWKLWFDHTMIGRDYKPPMSLVLTQADDVGTTEQWMSFVSNIMSRLCETLNIHHWYVTSACLEHSYDSVDAVLRTVVEECQKDKDTRRRACSRTTPVVMSQQLDFQNVATPGSVASSCTFDSTRVSYS